jgi:hypothetical protein
MTGSDSARFGMAVAYLQMLAECLSPICTRLREDPRTQFAECEVRFDLESSSACSVVFEYTNRPVFVARFDGGEVTFTHDLVQGNKVTGFVNVPTPIFDVENPETGQSGTCSMDGFFETLLALNTIPPAST